MDQIRDKKNKPVLGVRAGYIRAIFIVKMAAEV